MKLPLHRRALDARPTRDARRWAAGTADFEESRRMSQTILITGATGHQGGATLQHLRGKGFHLRAMTRKPGSDKAKALAAEGVEVVEGDLDDAASLGRALAGAPKLSGVPHISTTCVSSLRP